MSNYIYPAVFTDEGSCGFGVMFPDIEDCGTSGECLAEAISNAEDALSLMLYEMRKNGEEIPDPSLEDDICEEYPDAAIVMSIEGDPDFYERYFAEYHPEVS